MYLYVCCLFVIYWNKIKNEEETLVKQHRFWAWAMAFCMLMVFYTGKKHM